MRTDRLHTSYITTEYIFTLDQTALEYCEEYTQQVQQPAGLWGTGSRNAFYVVVIVMM